MVMRMPLTQISVLGRVTQGVRLINLKNDQFVSTVSLVDKEKEEEENYFPGNNQDVDGQENISQEINVDENVVVQDDQNKDLQDVVENAELSTDN